MKKTKVDHYTDKEALEFHSHKKPGKIEIVASKNMITKTLHLHIRLVLQFQLKKLVKIQTQHTITPAKVI